MVLHLLIEITSIVVVEVIMFYNKGLIYYKN